MSRITPLKPEEVIRKLKKLGFVGPIPGGKHTRMVHLEKQIIIPIHKCQDISVGLIRQIINETGVSREKWLEL